MRGFVALYSLAALMRRARRRRGITDAGLDCAGVIGAGVSNGARVALVEPGRASSRYLMRRIALRCVAALAQLEPTTVGSCQKLARRYESVRLVGVDVGRCRGLG